MTYYTFDSDLVSRISRADSRFTLEPLESDLWDSQKLLHNEEDIRKLTRGAYSGYNLSKNTIVDLYSTSSLDVKFDLIVAARKEIEKELTLNLDTYAGMRRSLGLSKFTLFYSSEFEKRKSDLLNVEQIFFKIRYSLYEDISGQPLQLLY